MQQREENYTFSSKSFLDQILIWEKRGKDKTEIAKLIPILVFQRENLKKWYLLLNKEMTLPYKLSFFVYTLKTITSYIPINYKTIVLKVNKIVLNSLF